MKKTGFTLAEALITLLIIGIVSAIMLPAITKIKPDEKKVAYLKAYDTLTKTINNIMNNSSYYSISANIDGHVVNASRFPLFNTAPGIKNPNKRYEGNKKLCNIFADSLGARNPDCRDEERGEEYTPDLAANSGDVSFKTQNGMRWWFVPVQRDAQNMVATLKTDVYVDVNPKGSNKCFYNANNDCADPDIYKFRIREDGRIYAMDAKGQGYIDTRRHWLKKDNIGVVANNDRGTRFSYEEDNGNNGGNGGGGGGGNEPPNNQPNNPDPNPNPEPEGKCKDGLVDQGHWGCVLDCRGKYKDYDVACVYPKPSVNSFNSKPNYANFGHLGDCNTLTIGNYGYDRVSFEDWITIEHSYSKSLPSNIKYRFYHGKDILTYRIGRQKSDIKHYVYQDHSTKRYNTSFNGKDNTISDRRTTFNYNQYFAEPTSDIYNNPLELNECDVLPGFNTRYGSVACVSKHVSGTRSFTPENYNSILSEELHKAYTNEELVPISSDKYSDITVNVRRDINCEGEFSINNGPWHKDNYNNTYVYNSHWIIVFDDSTKFVYFMLPVGKWSDYDAAPITEQDINFALVIHQ